MKKGTSHLTIYQWTPLLAITESFDSSNFGMIGVMRMSA